MTTEASPESPVPLTEYIRPRVDYDGSGLPLPFASRVVPRQGESEGDRLALGSQPVLTLIGEWEVIGTTGSGGYPAILRTVEQDGIVSASLNTVGNNKKYVSAILGYDPDIGSFGIATVWRRSQLHKLFGHEIEYYADSSDGENLGSILTSPSQTDPIAVVLGNRRNTDSPNYSWGSQSYAWIQTSTHDPWTVLTELRLRTYQTLIKRYAEAAASVNKPFNTTPPEKRRESSGNPEEALDLQEMYKQEFQDERDCTAKDTTNPDVQNSP